MAGSLAERKKFQSCLAVLVVDLRMHKAPGLHGLGDVSSLHAGSQRPLSTSQPLPRAGAMLTRQTHMQKPVPALLLQGRCKGCSVLLQSDSLQLGSPSQPDPYLYVQWD